MAGVGGEKRAETPELPHTLIQATPQATLLKWNQHVWWQDRTAKIPDADLRPFEKRINASLLNSQKKRLKQWLRERPHVVIRDQQTLATTAEVPVDGIHHCDFLRNDIDAAISQLDELAESYRAFQRRLPLASDAKDTQRLILKFAAELGASRWQLRGDQRAFRRHFDSDAVVERFHRRKNETEQRIEFALNRWGQVIARLMQQALPQTMMQIWRRLDVETVCRSIIESRFDERVQQAAWFCLRNATREIPPDLRAEIVRPDTLMAATRAAQDFRQPIWTQCAALEFLQFQDDETFVAVLQTRIRRPQTGDDFFVRRRTVRLAAVHLSRLPLLAELIPDILRDNSVYVRQAAGRLLAVADFQTAVHGFQKLIFNDSEFHVRAAALVEFAATVNRPELHFSFLETVAKVVRTEGHSFVIRTALHVATVWLEQCLQANMAIDLSAGSSSPATSSDQLENVRGFISRELLPAIRHLQTTSPETPVRRFAAQAAERLWLLLNPTAFDLAQQIQHYAGHIDSGESARLPKHVLRGIDEELLGRTLAVLAQDNFGYDVEIGLFHDTITRGYRLRFRLWRFLFEMRHPSPDKRQAFSHTIGRVSYAWLRAPSQILGELSETRVPGEPLFHIDEGGWKPYLPLLDDVISSLNQILRVRPVRFFNAVGITTLHPPKSALRRLSAWCRLTLRFSHYARLRNWDGNAQHAPDTYANELKKLGIRIEFAPHVDAESNASEDETVRRFFPPTDGLAAAASLPLLANPAAFSALWDLGAELFARFRIYFSSVYSNSVPQLVWFIGGFLAFFFLKHVSANISLRRARNSIPLSIGGWGTRGKSGTERLKAALLNAMGHSIVSKSSGCEAMFLYAPTYGSLREYILYRPYDKATIWEHGNVIRLASWMRAHVFIWECMGLTPSYVDVLQNQWTRDDLATITNTFPDHEDLQGPAGINVAETISVFVPPNSVLFTTEQIMRPVLQQAARNVRTQLVGVGWLESGMIPNEILDRFPYNEHPDNIALVQRMALELGCDEDYSLKEMADRMVPDLGVLQTSPPAPLNSRTLEFTNGMSANERLGCMGNWRRLGFDTQSHIDEPGTWITTVVNNRADRIARSRVFARIIVSDMSADRHVIIGNNLKGMLGYIADAWDEFAAEITLWPSSEADRKTHAIAQLDTMTQRLRQYATEDQVRSVLTAMLAAPEVSQQLSDANRLEIMGFAFQPDNLTERLTSSGIKAPHASDMADTMRFVVTGFQEYTALRQRIVESTSSTEAQIDDDFRALLREWYFRKLEVVEDYYASGEQVIQRIAAITPPGFRNRVIGLQNIKGTGLDFVYRWQSWQKVHGFCEQLSSDDAAEADNGLKQLLEFQDYGLLSDQFVRNTLQNARKAPFARRESTRTELDQVEANLDQAMERVRSGLNSASDNRQTGFLEIIASRLEEVLDLSDAVRRRKQSDRIYRDLGNERISQERSLLLLREINKRQKGGWVKKSLESLARGRKAA